MKILVDPHTHTSCSSHAFSTIAENLAMAKSRGLEAICMTNHGPSMPDSPHIWHFQTMHELPREVDGVRLLLGAEANVLDVQGHLDLPDHLLEPMDLVVASMHISTYPPRSPEEHTETWLNVARNPYVTILGHTGHPAFPYDHEPVIEAAKANRKCIEINNHSFYVREEGIENCRRIAETCKKMGAYVVVSSDAHTCFQIGQFDQAVKLLESVDFPEELIVNLTAERFARFLRQTRE